MHHLYQKIGLIVFILSLTFSSESQINKLPEIHIEVEPDLLWDEEIGMYVLGNDYDPNPPYHGANYWEDWEYPIFIQYFDIEGNLVFEGYAGAQIFGQWSRTFDQKSFSLFARNEYGTKNFKHQFFETRSYDKFESLLLRNAGNDWYRLFFRDALMTNLMEDSQVDYQAYQPVITYLNGEYWGIYNMREKISEHFIASLHGYHPNEIDLLEGNGWVKHGTKYEYEELKQFIESNSLADESNYKYVTDEIDEVNFIEYHVAQIYYNNTDWPGNNIRFWKTENTKWRWILYDTDFGLNWQDKEGHFFNTLEFATEPNGTGWPNPPWSTLFLRRLLENDGFKRKFINYFADAMNSRFHPSHAFSVIDRLSTNLEGEIINHRTKWGHDINVWYEEIDLVKSFFTIRPDVAREFIKTKFNLPATQKITIYNETPEYGRLKINSLTIDSTEWNGIYFQNNSISLTAYAKPGYSFDHWSGDINSTEHELSINLTSETSVTAHFVENGLSKYPIVINEINYNSPDEKDASDWVEIFNNSQSPVYISNWKLSDANDNNIYNIPENTILEAGEYLVICKNLSKFRAIHPSVTNIVGGLSFGFSSYGDFVRLFDESGKLMDFVNYLPYELWPEKADGTGPSLELQSPELDNRKAENWKSYSGYGSPGKENYPTPDINNTAVVNDLILFPNPGNFQLNVFLKSIDLKFISVKIFDMNGKIQLINDFFDQTHFGRVDISDLLPGQYVIEANLVDGSTREATFIRL